MPPMGPTLRVLKVFPAPDSPVITTAWQGCQQRSGTLTIMTYLTHLTHLTQRYEEP